MNYDMKYKTLGDGGGTVPVIQTTPAPSTMREVVPVRVTEFEGVTWAVVKPPFSPFLQS